MLNENATAGRPAWYDRNPAGQNNIYTNTVAPHAETDRWTYTVPSNKKAWLSTVCLQMTRVTVAAPIGKYYALMYYQPAGGSNFAFLYISSFANVAGDERLLTISPQMGLIAGDRLDCATQDLSTGGTVEYFEAATVATFDA